MRTLTIAGLAVISAVALLGAAAPSAPRKTHRFHQRGVAAATTCSTQNSDGYFVGVSGVGNVAGGLDTGVLAGAQNTACDPFSVIVGGSLNEIGYNGDAQASFIGAGVNNSITGIDSFVGAGDYNSSNNFDTFVGAGYYNAANSAAAFVGGGGSYYMAYGARNNGGAPGNIAGGQDSFVGAGDLNQITGNGSFIGAGGVYYANGGATTPGNQISSIDAFIGAGDQNSIAANNAFIGAGTSNGVTANGLYGAIVGGFSNNVESDYSTIGGGSFNLVRPAPGSAPSGSAFIGGGDSNVNTGAYGSLVGGLYNQLSGEYAAIAGGDGNIASGENAAIPGGYRNLASGKFSFAAGVGSYATTVGSFVWSDDATGAKHLATTKPNEFLARATGGFIFLTNAGATTGAKLPAGSGAWSSASDRNLKSDVSRIDDATILAKVAALPVSEWSYTSERGVRHVGPMAQDFYAAFRVGEDERHITAIDEDGVALAAIKALHADDTHLHADNARLHAENAGLRHDLTDLKAQMTALASEVASLRRR